MPEVGVGSLRIVDGYRLDKPRRDALMPGGVLRDRQGRTRQLPRYFYEVESWDSALEQELASEHRAIELGRRKRALRQVCQSLNPPRNAFMLSPRRLFGGNSSSSFAPPPPITT